MSYKITNTQTIRFEEELHNLLNEQINKDIQSIHKANKFIPDTKLLATWKQDKIASYGEKTAVVIDCFNKNAMNNELFFPCLCFRKKIEQIDPNSENGKLLLNYYTILGENLLGFQTRVKTPTKVYITSRAIALAVKEKLADANSLEDLDQAVKFVHNMLDSLIKDDQTSLEDENI